MEYGKIVIKPPYNRKNPTSIPLTLIFTDKDEFEKTVKSLENHQYLYEFDDFWGYGISTNMADAVHTAEKYFGIE